MEYQYAPITGSDGNSPQYLPSDRWQQWALHEIYTGDTGLKKFVPKIGDHVLDTVNDVRYRVSFVDPMTLISVLEEIGTGGLTPDLLAGNTADTFRIYSDDSVIPHTLAVDVRYRVPGTMVNHVKIFKGGDIGPTGKVVSALFDATGNYLTDKIPLENYLDPDDHTVALRRVAVAHTREKLRTGERLTVVVYDDQGAVVNIRSMVVINSSFIRSIDQGTKYVSHVTVDSPFVSDNDPNTLEYPLNVPLQALNMFGVVHYSNGEQLKLAIDGGKFKMHGLERYVATVVGQQVDLALSYALDPNEVAYGAVSADGKYMTAPYKLITTVQDGAYTVKLYGYPVWIAAEGRYAMRWFMMDLNRDVLFDVTPYVYYNSSSANLDSTAYGQIQTLSVRINLKDVSGGMKAYIHTQTMNVVIKAPGDDPGDRWLVGFDMNQTPYYGIGLKAKVEMINQNLWNVNIKSDIATQPEWVESVYRQTRPLFDLKKELKAPEPTHFVFVYGTTRTEYPIARWEETLQVGGELDITGTLYVEFIKRTDTGDLRLALAGFPIHEL